MISISDQGAQMDEQDDSGPDTEVLSDDRSPISFLDIEGDDTDDTERYDTEEICDSDNEEEEISKWDLYKFGWIYNTELESKFQDQGEDYIPSTTFIEEIFYDGKVVHNFKLNKPPCCLSRSKTECSNKHYCKYDSQRGCKDKGEIFREKEISPKLKKMYNILMNILSVYTSKTKKDTLTDAFKQLKNGVPDEYSENEFFIWCNTLFDLEYEQKDSLTQQENVNWTSRSVDVDDDIKITILYKYERNHRIHYVIESTTKDTTKSLGRFVLYESSSDLGVLKLEMELQNEGTYYKPNDYVTSTLINMKLQAFIHNLDKVDEALDDDNLRKQIEVTLTRNPYVINYFTTRKICNSSPALNTITNWINCLGIKCGEFLKKTPGTYCFYEKSNIPHPLYYDPYLLARFINDHQLDVELRSIPTNVGLNFFYIKIFRIIAAYYKAKFVAVSPPVKLFSSIQKFKEQETFTINTYQTIVKEKGTNNKFKYFYIEYKILTGFDWINPNEWYNFPLCIVPVDSSTLPFGVYDCYVPGGLYFCKPLEYQIQCSWKYSVECGRRTMGQVDQYYFFGDLLSGWIIPPPHLPHLHL